MTVFILSAIRGPDKILVGAFSSPEKVEEFKRDHPAVAYGSHAEYETEVVDLDMRPADAGKIKTETD